MHVCERKNACVWVFVLVRVFVTRRRTTTSRARAVAFLFCVGGGLSLAIEQLHDPLHKRVYRQLWDGHKLFRSGRFEWSACNLMDALTMRTQFIHTHTDHTHTDHSHAHAHTHEIKPVSSLSSRLNRLYSLCICASETEENAQKVGVVVRCSDATRKHQQITNSKTRSSLALMRMCVCERASMQLQSASAYIVCFVCTRRSDLPRAATVPAPWCLTFVLLLLSLFVCLAFALSACEKKKGRRAVFPKREM